MVTFLFAFTGAMIGGIFINYVLQGPQRFEEDDDTFFRNSAENYDD